MTASRYWRKQLAAEIRRNANAVADAMHRSAQPGNHCTSYKHPALDKDGRPMRRAA